MPTFIFSYRSAKNFDGAADPEGPAAWRAFLNEVIGPKVVDPGWPVFEPMAVLGQTGPSTQLGGYSIVSADDIEMALSMAKRCPTLTRQGGVEVGVLAELPVEHPAEQMRSRLSTDYSSVPRVMRRRAAALYRVRPDLTERLCEG